MINEPIGVSIAIDLNILQECSDFIKSCDNLLNSKMVHCSFKVENDKSRRGKKEINRGIIANNLKKNNINNIKLPPNIFLKEMVKTKFAISPEGKDVRAELMKLKLSLSISTPMELGHQLDKIIEKLS